jgi:hypothetical protein
MKLAQYFSQVSGAAKSEDGEKLSRLLRYSDPHASSIADELGGVNHPDASRGDAFPDAFSTLSATKCLIRTRILRDCLGAKYRRYGKKWSRAI